MQSTLDGSGARTHYAGHLGLQYSYLEPVGRGASIKSHTGALSGTELAGYDNRPQRHVNPSKDGPEERAFHRIVCLLNVHEVRNTLPPVELLQQPGGEHHANR